MGPRACGGIRQSDRIGRITDSIRYTDRRVGQGQGIRGCGDTIRDTYRRIRQRQGIGGSGSVISGRYARISERDGVGRSYCTDSARNRRITEGRGVGGSCEALSDTDGGVRRSHRIRRDGDEDPPPAGERNGRDARAAGVAPGVEQSDAVSVVGGHATGRVALQR